MYIMSKDEVLIVIGNVNDYLAKCSWMDFELSRLNGYQVVMAGCIDQSCNKHSIIIEFEQPNYISSLLSWHTDTTKPYIELASNEETIGLVEKYNIEHGNYVFKAYAENYKAVPIYIAAKKIALKIFDETPFFQK